MNIETYIDIVNTSGELLTQNTLENLYHKLDTITATQLAEIRNNVAVMAQAQRIENESIKNIVVNDVKNKIEQMVSQLQEEKDMKVEQDNKFYTNNWREFVHLQYLSEIMKLVPDVITPNENQDRVDRYEITVDENGEHPIKIVGVDKDGNKTELEYKPEITDRVNELIRDNVKVLIGEDEQDWKKLSFIKDPTHDYFEVNAKLTNGNTVNTIIPEATADDLKSINRIKAYDNKIEIDYLEENTQGQIVEQTKVYDLNQYVLKSVYDNKMEQIDNTLANIGEVHQLSDKACSYDCKNHGKVGHNIIYNLGDTGHMLVSYDVDFQGCLNQSLVAGEEWDVACEGVDLTTNTAYEEVRNWVDCTVEIIYDDETRKLVDAQSNFSHFKFTVPADAQRGHIKHARFNGILYFE